MAWNNTVRCSYCYLTGHNRRSCKELKKHIQNHPDSYQARHHKISMEHQPPRRCTYCSHAGHNRRTCETLLSDKAFFKVHLSKQRAAYREKMIAAGMGIGSLVAWQEKAGQQKTYLALLTSIPWAEVDSIDTVNYFFFKHVNLADTSAADGVRRFPVSFSVESEYIRYTHEVFNPLSAEQIDANIPSEWLSGALMNKNKMFASGQPRMWFFKENNSFD